MASCNTSQLVLASGRTLFYIEVNEGKLVQSQEVSMEHEVACIDITPLGSEEENTKADICAVGLWEDITVRILKLPSLEEITKESLGGGMF